MQKTLQPSFGFIGLGLIGGSVAHAIRASVKDAFIVVYDPDPDTLTRAKKDGVADVTTTSIDTAFKGLTVVFLCAPVEENNKNAGRLQPYLSEETTLTDIGSVKSGMHKRILELGLERQFVGGHPMTGSERTGYRNAKASLLENAFYILTHTEGVEIDRLMVMQDLIETIGAIPFTLTAEEHDAITGTISHLPHVIAASLVNLVRTSDDAMGTMRQIAAGGFKDITRISSSSPELWQQICLMNRDRIVAVLDRYLEELKGARNLIANRSADALYDYFEDARAYRETLSDTVAGPIQKTYVLYVDIADEAGQIASVLGLISDAGISVKNVNITHNREVAYGAMMIAFYDDIGCRQAHALLQAKGYPVSAR